MPYYICALPNVKRQGQIRHLISDDLAAIETFARKYDRPGFAVYDCVSILRPGATRRSLRTVAELPVIHVDIDARTLATPAETILSTLIDLPLPFEIRFSGGGFHVLARLKEPVEADTDEFERANQLRTG